MRQVVEAGSSDRFSGGVLSLFSMFCSVCSAYALRGEERIPEPYGLSPDAVGEAVDKV